MKAMVWTKYDAADGLQMREVPKPTPKANEVLIRVRATTATAGESELLHLKFPLLLHIPLRIWLGFRRPRNVILGQEVAGEIESVGATVTRFKPGDPVFGWTGLHLGAYAEYVCLRETAMLAAKPSNLTYAEAAAVAIGGLEALDFLKRANIRRAQQVLINGAGGSIGTLAVQYAKSLGAEVTAVDRAEKLDMLRRLGADHVVDYTREDFTQRGQTYDVIFDEVGKGSYAGSIRSLKPNGRYLLGNPGLSQTLRRRFTPPTDGKTVITRSGKPTSADLLFLKELLETGTLKAVIGRCYPLDQAAEAHRYVETGLKQGNVVILVQLES